MELEKIITSFENKDVSAIKVKLDENSVLVLKDVRIVDDGIVYKTLSGDIYKTYDGFKRIYPLLKDNQYYLELF